MPKYRIKAPDGATYEYDVPEGTPEQEVIAFAQQQHGGPAAAPGDGSIYNEPVQTVDIPQSSARQEGENWYQNADGSFKPLPQQAAETAGGFVQGVAKPFDKAADLLASAFGSEAPPAAQQMAAQLPGNAPGRFAGNMAAVGWIPGGPVVQGAAGGALLSDRRDATGLLIDAGLGAVGGKVGDIATRGVAGIVAPQLSDDLATLARAGVRTSPGQTARAQGGTLNRFLARREDAATSHPLTGELVTNDRNRSLEDFNRAIANRALQEIGETLPDTVPVGRRLVAHTGDRLSAKFDELLPRMQARGDDEFLSDMADIHAETASMTPERAQQFNNILTRLGRFFGDGGTALTGAEIKEVDKRLAADAARYARSPDADQQQLGDALNETRDALHELLARSNPDMADQLRALNRGWKTLTQLENSSGTASGLVTPAGFSQAVKRSSDTVRRRGYARGEALNQDLSDAASAVLPSEIGDPGTATRLNQANILGLIQAASSSLPYAAARGLNAAYTRDVGPNSQYIAELLNRLQPLAVSAGTVTPSTIGITAPQLPVQ